MSAVEGTLQFGPLRLDLPRRQLLVGGVQLHIEPAAFAVLALLARQPGIAVPKQCLAERLALLGRHSLRRTIELLNQSLASTGLDQVFVVDLGRAGYMLVTPALDGLQKPTAALHRSLPRPIGTLIGRGQSLEVLLGQMSRHPVVTIIGPGGIGKTRFALAAAERLDTRFSSGIRLVELGSETQDTGLVAAVASALNIATRDGMETEDIIAGLQGQEILLVLDNCERVAGAVSALVGAMVNDLPDLHVLATSREPLRVEGEVIHRLSPLMVPAEPRQLSLAEAGEYSAVQLFVERAAIRSSEFRLTDNNVGSVAELCAHLDGLPLAIELVAAWVENYGVDGLLSQIDRNILRLTLRSQPSRSSHRSLERLVDWSHSQLSDEEQGCFQQLSVFRNRFTLAMALELAGPNPDQQAAMKSNLVHLANKSLVSVDRPGFESTYRLLESHRSFALEKLVQGGQLERVRRRHAEVIAAQFEHAELDRKSLERDEWLARYSPRAADVNAALDWAFSTGGDIGLAIRLTASSLHLGLSLSLANEYRKLVESALGSSPTLRAVPASVELQFNVALGGTLAITQGPGPSMDSAVQRLSTLARRADTAVAYADSLYGQWVGAFSTADYAQAADFARELVRTAVDEASALAGTRMLAQAMHGLGHQVEARVHAEEVLRRTSATSPRILGSIDSRVSMRIVLSRILWLQGRPELATKAASEAVAIASADVSQSICQALAWAAIPVALWCGDRSSAEAYTDALADNSARHGLGYWEDWAKLYMSATQSPKLQPALNSTELLNAKQLDLLATIAPCASPQVHLDRVRGGTSRWSAPELLRTAAVALWDSYSGHPGPQVEELLRQSLTMAETQGAVAWQLRTTTSLAALLQSLGRGGEACSLLRQLLGEMERSPGWKDFESAEQMLASIEAS